MRSVVDVGDVARSHLTGTEIVKLHGDLERGPEVILTESSYFERLDFSSPLDIKLKADALGKSLLFVGYSLSDINIRLLLYRLNKLWQDVDVPDERPQSFLLLSRPNPIHERVWTERGIRPIVAENDDPGEALLGFLQALQQSVLAI